MATEVKLPVEKLEGRELDAAAAEEIVGADVRAVLMDGSLEPVTPNGHAVPRYSNDIVAAWKVVEKLGEMGFYVGLSRTTDGRHFCNLIPSDAWVEGPKVGPCNSGPEAICRAALKAVRAN